MPVTLLPNVLGQPRGRVWKGRCRVSELMVRHTSWREWWVGAEDLIVGGREVEEGRREK